MSRFISVSELAMFLHESLKPYEDPLTDITCGIRQAISNDGASGGFIALALDDDSPIGALVLLDTHMKGFVPPNLVLYVAVSPTKRGMGVGTALLLQSIERCDGAVKLHVENDNPAKSLYERLGFIDRYAEMRRG